MIRIRFLFFITTEILLVVFNAVLTAQTCDNAFWGSAGVKIKLTKKIDFTVEEQLRFNENYSYFNTNLVEAGISYELTDKIALQTTFRYYYDPESHNKYRYTGDFSYSWNKKGFPLRLKYRVRFQSTTEEHTKRNSSYIRNRFSIEYNLTKIADPYIKYEPYFKLNYIYKFTANRYYAGIEWKILNNLNLDTYFMVESEFGEPNPSLTKVIGLGLTYNFVL